MRSIRSHRQFGHPLTVLFLLLTAFSLACSLPGIFSKTPTPTALGVLPVPTITSTPAIQPPLMVESDPQAGAQLSLTNPITIYFNQPMNRLSVEGAVQMSAGSGRFDWQSDEVMTFIPDVPMLPESEVTFSISVTAQSEQGMPLKEPVELRYTTASYLQLTQPLPGDGEVDLNPTTAVVAAFNQPVVPLGADPAGLPPAFSLEPAASGRGEWINTSTYIFYPEPQFAGGVTYTARMNSDLTSTQGAPLQEAGEWSFSFAAPSVERVEPQKTVQLPLDAPLTVYFNQPMDAASTAEGFQLQAEGQPPVSGDFTWDDTFTTLTFTPSELLQRDQAYELALDPAAVRSAAGTPLEAPFSTTFFTVAGMFQVDSTPDLNGMMQEWEGLLIQFSSLLPKTGFEKFFRIEPEVTNLNASLDMDDTAVHFFGDFLPNRSYTVFVDSALQDRWGGTLQNAYNVTFRTAPLTPRLEAPGSQSVMFLTPEDTGMAVQLTNLSSLPLSLGSIPLADFFSLSGAGGYDLRQAYQPADSQYWTADFSIPADRVTPVQLPLNAQETGLAPGIYLLRAEVNREYTYANDFVLLVSHIHLTYKISDSDVLVWAVDTRSNQPLENAPVVIYDETGQVLASGFTGAGGVFQAELAVAPTPYTATAAVMGQPGEEYFAAALSNWSAGVESYNFNIIPDTRGDGPFVYLYTDRPIYRPGQTVYYRGVARVQDNGRYALPDGSSTLPVVIYDFEGTELAQYDLALSAFGTLHGEFKLIEDAPPGYYRLQIMDESINFQVAEYRKPEINLQVQFSQAQAQAGDELNASIDARYFFDAPAGNVAVTWTLYEAAASFPIPGYQTGLVDDGWLAVFDYGDIFGGLGRPVETGSGVTAPDGTLSLELPNLRESDELGSGTRRYTLEVTATDESGLPVSARGEVLVHPAEFYIGVQPDGWSGQAGVEMGYAVQVVDWQNNPAGARPLQASFRKVEYVRQDPPPERIYDGPTWEAQYTDISSVNLTTGVDGKARLAFTAPEPGTYQLEISGDGARTQVLVWVGGPGQALWPNLPNQRLRLTPDQETYQPGETASIFMPNPFPQAATALITVERGVVMRYEVRSLAAGGSTIELPLGDEDAPNVYVSVTLLGQSQGGQADFRQGYATLEVTPVEQTLQVSLTSQPERLAPGEGVTFSIRVTDASGQPVEGEFSISVVDLAVLALADPNAADILTAFYGTQPLGVRTSLSLAAYANRQFFVTGGLGGGGGAEAASMVRSDFPDTAYWNATVLTDANGEATVNLRLPDNLTTWQVDVRGLTADTRVGQAQLQVVATKDLLIRPVTPRFLVAGDHALLAAVVQNNTAADLPAQVSLQGSGFKLDEGQAAVQDVTVPAGGRVRVTWWGTAQDVHAADLVFSVQAGQYQDAAQPTLGPLPVLRYTASQAFATAGYLEGAVQQLELVSLPRGAQVSSEPGSAGELRVELAPSLAASMLTALDALEYYEYECTEQTLARFLPNLLLHQALQTFNIQIPEVQSRLERTLQPGLEKLAGRQNEDGGWGWWIGDPSNAYLTSYVVLGLAQAQQAGADISEDALQRAVDFLNNQFTAPDQIFLPFELDRLAFQYYALAQAGYPDEANTVELVALRDQLSPWAQALLALALDAAVPGSPEAKDLLAGLQASAQRSATGVFWSDPSPRWQNMNSTVTTTAMVIYALALKDPASSLLPDAIRFLMAGRGAEGAWASTFETTWALMAATTFMQGTGELGGDYSFQATLNGAALASGQAGGDTRLTPVTAAVPVASLYPADPNALTFERSAGAGRLYYRALLDVNLPADQVQALNRGFVIERAYYLPGEAQPVLAAPVLAAPVLAATATSRMTVHLTLVASQDMYYVVVEDFIPAGGEILNTSLNTSQIGDPAGFEEPSTGPIYDPGNPFDRGWGWWFFNAPQIYDDHITWTANFLPAGTYELTYTVTLLQEGEFRLLPARAYQFYFPDVQGNSAGAVFTIQP